MCRQRLACMNTRHSGRSTIDNTTTRWYVSTAPMLCWPIFLDINTATSGGLRLRTRQQRQHCFSAPQAAHVELHVGFLQQSELLYHHLQHVQDGRPRNTQPKRVILQQQRLYQQDRAGGQPQRQRIIPEPIQLENT